MIFCQKAGLGIDFAACSGKYFDA